MNAKEANKLAKKIAEPIQNAKLDILKKDWPTIVQRLDAVIIEAANNGRFRTSVSVAMLTKDLEISKYMSIYELIDHVKAYLTEQKFGAFSDLYSNDVVNIVWEKV